MKIHRFFINHKIQNQDQITLIEHDLIHQIKNVLRMNVGDPIILLDGEGREYHGTIKVLIKKELIISKEIIKDNKDIFKRNITLASSLIKRDKYEWVLQKGTEIGVTRFVPLITERTEKINLNMKRAYKIVTEACEQSERTTLPIIDFPVNLEKFLNENRTNVFCFMKDGKDFLLKDFSDNKGITIMVGPEGGFSEKDLQIIKENKISCVSLGDKILRAETAAIVIPSILLFS